ncbi:MAG: hypothetical protein H0X33_07850 [Taibaiella sp.]|nr:hypothetical protein [Taibaiella sp.]
MKRHLLSLGIVAIMAILSFTSCSKSSTNPTPQSLIVGTWNMNTATIMGYPITPASLGFTLISAHFNADSTGTIRVDSGHTTNSTPMTWSITTQNSVNTLHVNTQSPLIPPQATIDTLTSKDLKITGNFSGYSAIIDFTKQ